MIYVGQELRFELARLGKFIIGRHQLFSALNYLVLKARISVVKMRRHRIKLVGEHLDLISSFYIEPRAEVTFAYEFHSFTERFEWTNHSSANQKSSQQSHTKPNEEQNGSAQQRSINRLIRFFERPFNEHSPVKDRDESVRAKNRLPLYALRYYGLWLECVRVGLKSRLHLIELAHVVSLQQQIFAWVGDQIAGTGNDIYVTRLSKFNRRDQV